MSDALIVKRQGCPLHYWLDGPPDAPLVALTHGAAMDHRAWAAQVPVLARHYRVLTWDVRGHGLSRPWGEGYAINRAADDLLALLDAAGAATAILIGHSIGGSIVQEVVYRQPDRVSALSVIGATCTTLPLALIDRVGVRVAPLVFPLLPYTALKRASAKGGAVRSDVRQYVREVLDQTSKAELVAYLTGMMRGLHPEPGYRITQPLLLTHGDQDHTGNVRRVAPIWARREPNCQYVIIPNAAHCAQLDNPEFYNRVLLDFLARNL